MHFDDSDAGDESAAAAPPGRSICHTGCGRPSSPDGKGEEIEEAMVGVLRAMVEFQAKHLQHRVVKPRVKMRKKKELKREEEMRRNAGLV
ncbi:hypothetical protein PR202_gb00566 [Eleusine coracana subsp. coracana]|uniref:Uncharacterized protein n=1 Tax=Eleusine coracana subsp. coracana TaxID=191504 RepID=A0AAV5DTP3_ELECO|nr:hypothetical protein PR202_gb00566 [Eleusine coracana subsp. coracana]